jgi:hypothetical protein
MSGMVYTELKADPKRALTTMLIGNGYLSSLLCTHKSVMTVRKNKDGRITRSALLVNHYINGVNHWEYRFNVEATDLSLYYTGDTFDTLKPANLTVEITVLDEDYQDYIKKFKPYAPIKTYVFDEFVGYNVMPKIDRRDNKSHKVGSGGEHYSKVRFPRKVRGKSTWERFWTMFPRYRGYKSLMEYQKDMYEKHKIEIQKKENEEVG